MVRKSPAPAHLPVLILACALLAAPAVWAQGTPDVGGTWELDTDVFLSQPEGLPDCEYEGSAQITQDGNTFGGTSSLTLVQGGQNCPAEMTADVDGSLDGPDITMGMLMGGQLGTADFFGTVAEFEGQQGTGGGFDVTSGPFDGSFGTWNAVFGGGPSVLEIPTLTAFGLVALVALLLGAAAFVLRRRTADATGL